MGDLSSFFLNRALRLTILPTEKCNYRCVYCYEDFRIGTMPVPVRRRVMRLIESRVPGLDSVAITWFGGEPLLAFPVIEQIMRCAQRACDAAGAALSSSMTTNGHLLDAERFGRLIGLGVTYYQITLDGPEDIHNRRRRTIKGDGDYARICANLRAMIASTAEFSVSLRIHVDHANAGEIGRLLDDIADILADRRIGVSFDKLAHYGKPLPDAVRPMSRQEFLAFQRAMLASRSAILGDPEDKARQHEDYVCYAAKPNNYVIRADGRVQKCTVLLESDHNHVGTIGEDGEIVLNDRHARWLAGWAAADNASLHCPAKAIMAQA